MRRLHFTQRPIFSDSLTSLKSQSRDRRIKVPPRGVVIRIFTSWKIHRAQPGLNLRTLRLARYPETDKISNKEQKSVWVCANAETFSDFRRLGPALPRTQGRVWPIFYFCTTLAGHIEGCRTCEKKMSRMRVHACVSCFTVVQCMSDKYEVIYG